MFDKDTLDLLDEYRAAGFSAYAVGGCVRDALMGREAHDIDIATDAMPEDTERIFSGSRIIKTGIAHGTVTLLRRGRTYEATVYRSESGYSDSRHPDSVRLGVSLEEDLSRRDFTVNAMAWDRGGVIDLFGGKEDLKNGVLRAVGDPDRRFSEDALRILRAMRFSSVLGFSIEKETGAAMERNRALLRKLSAERVYSELCGILAGSSAASVMDRYRAITAEVIPELKPCMGHIPRGAYSVSGLDIYGHTLRTVEAVPDRTELRFAALLYELGLPYAEDICDPGCRKHSAELACTVLERLKSPRALRARVCSLVGLYGVLSDPDVRTVKRRLAEYGPELFFDLLELQEAGAADRPGARELYALIRSHAGRAMEEGVPLSRSDLAVNGDDMLKLGAQGAQIRDLLDACLRLVLDGSVPNEKEALLSEVRKLLSQPF